MSMSQERNSGVSVWGASAEVVAGTFLAPGLKSGNPYEIGIRITLALISIGVDFVVKVRDHKRGKQEDKNSKPD